MSNRKPCSSCERLFKLKDLTEVCEVCKQDANYYHQVYMPETDDRRFNLSFFDPSVMEEKSFCKNCVTDCRFCEYSVCEKHTHSIELPWFEFPLNVCWECNDFHKKSFHFAHVLSGKVQFDEAMFDEEAIDEATRITEGNKSFHHKTEDEVMAMTDENKLRYFQIKYLLYKNRNK